jgi:hypothetical protein
MLVFDLSDRGVMPKALPPVGAGFTPEGENEPLPYRKGTNAPSTRCAYDSERMQNELRTIARSHRKEKIVQKSLSLYDFCFTFFDLFVILLVSGTQ